MHIIDVNIKENKEVIISSNNGGNIGESHSAVLNFSIPSEYSDYYKYLDIQKNGQIKTQTVLSTKNESKFSFSLPTQLTCGTELILQLIMKKENNIFKSNLFYIVFNGSICATQKLEDDYQDTIQFILENKTDISKTNEIEERKLDKSVFYDFTNVQNEILNTKADKNDSTLVTENKNLSEAINELYNTKAEKIRVEAIKSDLTENLEVLEISLKANSEELKRIENDKTNRSELDLLEARIDEEIALIDNKKVNGDALDLLEERIDEEIARIDDNKPDWPIIDSLESRLEEEIAKIGDINSALDELHNYAQALINGGAE